MAGFNIRDLAMTPKLIQIHVDGVPYKPSEIIDGLKNPPVSSNSEIRMIGELSIPASSDPKKVIEDINRSRKTVNLSVLPDWLICEKVIVRRVPPEYLLVGRVGTAGEGHL